MNKTAIYEIENGKYEHFYGLGGWLAFIQVITIIGILADMFSVLVINLLSNRFLNIIGYSLSNTNIIFLIIANILAIASLVFLWRRSMWFRTFFLIHIAVGLVMNIYEFTNGTASSGTLLGSILGALLWGSYVFKSERIKNTLRKVGQEKTEYEIYMLNREKELAENQELIEKNTAE